MPKVSCRVKVQFIDRIRIKIDPMKLQATARISRKAAFEDLYASMLNVQISGRESRG